jgi:hypothetical protein
MFLDLDYCSLLLQYAAKMYQHCVLRGLSPPRDVFYNEAGYQKLLQRTKSIAAGSRIVAVVAAPEGAGLGVFGVANSGMFYAASANEGVTVSRSIDWRRPFL